MGCSVKTHSVVLSSFETHACDQAEAAEIYAVHHIPSSDPVAQVEVIGIAELGRCLRSTRSGDSVKQARVGLEEWLDFIPAYPRPIRVVTVVVVLVGEAVEELGCQRRRGRVGRTVINLEGIIKFVSVAKIEAGFESTGMGSEVIALGRCDRAFEI